MQLGTGAVGMAASLLSMIITLLGTLITIRMRQQNRKHRLRHELEEKLVQSSSWIFETRSWAAQTGHLQELPVLPQILQMDYVQGKAEGEQDLGPYTQFAETLKSFGEQIEQRGKHG